MFRKLRARSPVWALLLLVPAVFLALLGVEFSDKPPRNIIFQDGSEINPFSKPSASATTRFLPGQSDRYQALGPQCAAAKALKSAGIENDRKLIEYVWREVISDHSPEEINLRIMERFPEASSRISVAATLLRVHIVFCFRRGELGTSMISFGPLSSVELTPEIIKSGIKYKIMARVLDYPKSTRAHFSENEF